MLTTIRGTTDKKTIEDAVQHYLNGLLSFLNPPTFGVTDRKYLREFGELHKVIESRLLEVSPQLADILLSINRRAEVINSPQYIELANLEQSLWAKTRKVDFEVGIRACVDAGLTREAVAGTGAHLGRSLAGDDDLIFVKELSGFRLKESVMKKKLIHAVRGGKKKFLEILIEHTGCGRRGQMISNIDMHTEITRNFEIVFENISHLLIDKEKVKIIEKIWPKKMLEDGGVWAGIWVKKAQRQAYEAIDEIDIVMPIMLYDKQDGNVWVGVDQESVLFDPEVIEAGGFTRDMLGKLANMGKIWCLKNEMKNWDEVLDQISIEKGKYSFVDLQNNWLEVKKAMIQVCADLWEHKNLLSESLDRYVLLSGLREKSDVLIDRYIHQLFRMFSYLWTLDTLERGNLPGNHMEDHLASGESAVLGVKEHLPLGQGGLQVPTASEFFTGRSVLLHSTPGKEGKPIIVLMKHDTSESDENPLSGEETQRAMDDFAELLKLWPYILVGDLVPVVVVRSKKYLGISRLALSVVLAFGDIVQLAADEESLPDIVQASNTLGEVVVVPAAEILRVGVEAKDNLSRFRELVTSVADNYSNEIVQTALRGRLK